MERARKAIPIFLLPASRNVCTAQGIFTATGPTTVARAGHTARCLPILLTSIPFLLATGKIFIGGSRPPDLPGTIEQRSDHRRELKHTADLPPVTVNAVSDGQPFSVAFGFTLTCEMAIYARSLELFWLKLTRNAMLDVPLPIHLAV